MYQRYAPHKVYMSNVVKTAGCRPLFPRRKRRPRWVRLTVNAFAFLFLVISFFVAMFIIADVVVK